jgi:hypothetical protein
MTSKLEFSDTYLRRLSPDVSRELDMLRDHWSMDPKNFVLKLDGWISNFESRDKSLALRLLKHITYYSEEVFKDRLRSNWKSILQYLSELGLDESSIRLIVPAIRGDSADRHAYEALKSFGLTQKQILDISTLNKSNNKNMHEVLVFLNDTHGTGNQFIRDFINSGIHQRSFRAIFLIGVTIGEKAAKRFYAEIPELKIIPEEYEPSAFELLSWKDCERVRSIGKKVYPPHPMGYGNAALLTAYEFQCPNNSLPVIWADGENNKVDGRGYPWTPLFRYRPKKSVKTRNDKKQSQTVDLSPLKKSLNLSLTKSELQGIENNLKCIGLTGNEFVIQLKKWLNNFHNEEKPLALELIKNIRYWDLSRTRTAIKDLQSRIMSLVKADRCDREDILLVTTGHHKNSVYHYVFDFMQIFGLETQQVCDFTKLTADKALDRTLLFFYHSRRNSEHTFFNPREGQKSYYERALEVKPRRIIVAAFSASKSAICAFENEAATVKAVPFNFLYNAEASQLLCDSLKNKDLYKKILRELDVPKDRWEKDLLISYYFQCPKNTSPLLWKDIRSGGTTRPWVPLFQHRRISQ